MPQRFIPMLEPIVRHGMQELNAGAPIPHVLRQVALTSALVGTGMPAGRAHRIVEALEPMLLGMGPWERFEPYHQGYQPMYQQGYQPMYQQGQHAGYWMEAAPQDGTYGR